MKELALKYGCNPNQKPSRIYMTEGELPVEYNLLSVQDIKHGNAENDIVYKVFYLNRWICVKFRLPLGYGGWKAVSIKKASMLLNSDEDEYEKILG